MSAQILHSSSARMGGDCKRLPRLAENTVYIVERQPNLRTCIRNLAYDRFCCNHKTRLRSKNRPYKKDLWALQALFLRRKTMKPIMKISHPFTALIGVFLFTL